MNVLEGRFGDTARRDGAHNDAAAPQSEDREAERGIAEMVAAIYEAAPVAARVRLLDFLLRPLGALSILVVADGVFGRIWFRHGWCEFRIRPEDIADVQPEHVVALVEHVLQRSADTVYALPELLGATPPASRSAAVERLWALLERQPAHPPGAHAMPVPTRMTADFGARRAAAG
jgi:hypothetical protein